MTTKRSCTDLIWVVLFVAALCGFGYTVFYAAANGRSLRQLSKLPDFQGRRCGEDGRGQYVYFCQSGKQDLGLGNFLAFELRSNICVNSCPTAESILGSDINMCDGLSLVTPSLYASYPFAGALCLPKDKKLQDTVLQQISGNEAMTWLMRFSVLQRVWQPIAISAGASLLLSFLYLFTIRSCGCFLVALNIISLVVSTALGGGFLILVAQAGLGQSNAAAVIQSMTSFFGLSPAKSSMVTNFTLGSPQVDIGVGIGLFVFAFLIIIIALCEMANVRKAMHCIEGACQCIFEEPLIFLEPIFAVLAKILVSIPLMIGFIALLLIGKIQSSYSGGDFTLDAGRESLQKSGLDVAVLVYYSFMSIWIFEVIHAFSEFVLAYTVESWYFDKHAQILTILFRAQFDGIVYHTGSLICAAFLSTTLIVLRFITEICAKASSDAGNPASACVCHLCTCCVSCFSQCLQWISKNAFMDVALNSVNYCTGAVHVLETLASHGNELAILHGTTLIFQVTGVAGISSLCGLISFLIVTLVPAFNTSTSSTFCTDPLVIVASSTLAGFLVCLPFVHMLGMISDTILYCEATMEKRKAVEVHSNGEADVGCWGNCYSSKGGKASSSETEKLLK